MDYLSTASLDSSKYYWVVILWLHKNIFGHQFKIREIRFHIVDARNHVSVDIYLNITSFPNIYTLYCTQLSLLIRIRLQNHLNHK